MKTRWLQCLIFIQRRGTASLVLILVWLAACGLALHWFLLRHTVQIQQQELSTLQEKTRQQQEKNSLSFVAALPEGNKPPLSAAEEFQTILGHTETLEEYLKKLFQIAGKKNLSLPQGSYKTSTNAAGGYESYSIELPVVGNYQKIRELSEEILLALPFSALEEIRFKRDSASHAILEAKLKFVLFLLPEPADHGMPTGTLPKTMVQEKP